MTVTAHDVERVAELANLELSSSEKTAMLRDLNSLLEHFAELNELDTTTVPAMAQAGSVIQEAKPSDLQPESSAQFFREDEVAPSLDRERVLACAPDSDGVFFKVPKVIER